MSDRRLCRHRGIAAAPLATCQVEEKRYGFFLALEIMHQLLPFCAYSPPSTAQADFVKECLLDGEGIKPGHVFLLIGALDINSIGLRKHGQGSRVANLLSNQSFESITGE